MTDSDKQPDQPKDPRDSYHSGGFPEQVQEQPGLTALMEPKPDHGEESYEGSNAVPHLKAGASIITTASIQAFNPSPGLIDYAMTKGAQVAFTKALAQELGPKGIRVNAVAPGPIWTPLIPATVWPEKLPKSGQDTPLGRAGQPAELAAAYVLLASDHGSYISGAVLPVTGGKGL